MLCSKRIIKSIGLSLLKFLYCIKTKYMLFSRPFKLPKPNKFGYTPVYYDEKKEKRAQEASIASEKLDDAKSFNKEDFRGRFNEKVSSHRKTQKKAIGFSGTQKARSQSNIRVLLLLAIAGAIIYWQFIK